MFGSSKIDLTCAKLIDVKSFRSKLEQTYRCYNVLDVSKWSIWVRLSVLCVFGSSKIDLSRLYLLQSWGVAKKSDTSRNVRFDLCCNVLSVSKWSKTSFLYVKNIILPYKIHQYCSLLLKCKVVFLWDWFRYMSKKMGIMFFA